MLAAEAARLALIECLCPTAALAADANYPTLAGSRIADSRAVAMQDLDPDQPYTPFVAVYSGSASSERRGDAAGLDDMAARCTIDVVAELAVLATDDQGDFADAMAGSDPEAKLVLAALTAQIRRIVVYGEGGGLFRKAIKAVERVSFEPFAQPDLGLRWQRMTMSLTCLLRDDVFTDAAGLPEPARTIAAALPEGSYAKGKLDALAARIAAEIRTPLEQLTIRDGRGVPVASVGDFTE